MGAGCQCGEGGRFYTLEIHKIPFYQLDSIRFNNLPNRFFVSRRPTSRAISLLISDINLHVELNAFSGFFPGL